MEPEVQIRENYQRIRERIDNAAVQCGRRPEDITFMAVTKTVPPERVNAAIDCGITQLGENRVQEYLSKKDAYDRRAHVQFIGQLQTNKVKYIVDSVSMIQSVDSLRLAQEISRQAQRVDKVQEVLLEVNIAGEESKGGIAPEALEELLYQAAALPNLHVCGLMTIPPPTDSEKFLCRMQQLYIDISAKNIDNIDMRVLSMGMSGDYEAAIRYGSTLVRIGSALFGKRNYQ